MMQAMPPVYFYLPQKQQYLTTLETQDFGWSGFKMGIYCWVLQTFLRLQAAGFLCELVDDIPDRGIVLAHRDSLQYRYQPPPQVLLVCLKADRSPHPYAQVHVVQNSQDLKRFKRYYMPHWPQPGLIPRERSRGMRLETVVYFGVSFNLAPELKDPTWAEQLGKMGLSWQVRTEERWHDYSDADAVVAVRHFYNRRKTYDWKPATKLYNAWHAGVPAILGVESAFQAERQSPLDYFEVQTPEDVLEAIAALKRTPNLYQQMVENGFSRSSETAVSTLVERWSRLISQDLTQDYFAWAGSSNWQQKHYLRWRSLVIKQQAVQQKVDAFLGITRPGPTHPKA